jgi:hypothetical protein
VKFSRVKAERRKPLRTLVIEPTAFCDDWALKPTGSVAIGLRLLSDAQEAEARREAEQAGAKIAAETKRLDDGIEEYNRQLLAAVVINAVCDPNDVEQLPECVKLSGSPDLCRRIFTSYAIRHLFQEIEKLAVESSPAHLEADDEQLGTVAASIVPMVRALQIVDPDRAARIRRYAKFILDDLLED